MGDHRPKGWRYGFPIAGRGEGDAEGLTAPKGTRASMGGKKGGIGHRTVYGGLVSSHGKGSPQRKLRTPFLRLAALSRERRLPVSGVSETKGDRGEGSTSRPPAGSETANKSRESCR